MNIDRFSVLNGSVEQKLMPENRSAENGTPDFGFNLFNKLGKLYTPVLDKDAMVKPNWPDGKKFALCLTHDVDSVSQYALRRPWNSIVLALKNLGKPEYKKRLINNCYHYLNNFAHRLTSDPYHHFEKWLDLESQFDAHSTFFFFPEKTGKKHFADCGYSYNENIKFAGQKCSVKELMQEIDRRGWEIGLHASCRSFDDVDEMKFQKEQVEKAIGYEIKSVRQHCLYMDIKSTPVVQNAAGLKYDSSLGFNSNIGFRFGTSYPWHLYDSDKEKQLEILEIPLAIMDCALLSPNRCLALDKATAVEYCKLIIDEVEKVKGVVTLLWHPEYVSRESWFLVYKEALRYAKQKNAWFGSVGEIGDYWNGAGIDTYVENNTKALEVSR
ncbi:MAG: hypothetical protein DRP65_00960 [Planctomycetota bacterium]|nr:MAG: hypothetical protein DRP65_00960 [Planctomycetota bacterium]